jgi:hypothetical protein
LDGSGIVIINDAYPAAHELAEAGWLERYFHAEELCWRWSQQGDTALELSDLLSAAQGREN